MSLRTTTTASVIVVVAVFAFAWLARNDEAPPMAQSPRAAKVVVVDQVGSADLTRNHEIPVSQSASRSASLDAGRRVRERGSLRGADRDGEIALAADGTLRVDRDLRRVFDWYLSTIGELDRVAIRELMQSDLTMEFGAATAAQVLTEFDRYANYLAAENNLQPHAVPGERLGALRALRRERLGDATAEAYFGEEERYAEATLARLEAGRAGRDDVHAIAADPHALEAETAALVAEQNTQFERLDIDTGTRNRERAVLWGRDAAQRLAALDHERADWQQRIHAYQGDAAAIRRNARLDAASRARALVALRQRNFSAEERLRIESLEAIGQLPPPG